MAYLIAILASILLLAGFLFLVATERSRGFRLFPRLRDRLDKRVSRGAFVIRHVDWSAFLKHLVQATAARIAHDLVQITLFAVRFLERTLTRLVRYLRERRSSDTTPTPQSHGLRATLIHFRKRLSRTRAKGESVVQNTEGE